MPENEQTDNGAVEGKKETKVEFTAEQQKKLDELINGTFAKAFDKAKKEAAAEAAEKLKALEAELKAVKESAGKTTETPPQPEVKPEKKTTVAEVNNDVLQIKAQLEEFKNIAEQLKRDKAEAEKREAQTAEQNRKAKLKEKYIAVSDKFNFFDRMSEFSQMEPFLKADGDRIVVMNPETGHPRLNTNLEPMTLEEYVAEYAKQKPWTVKAPTTEVAGGSGASEQRKLDTGRTDSKDYTKMTLDEIKAESERVIAKQYERQR
jgi:hypothetical protein